MAGQSHRLPVAETPRSLPVAEADGSGKTHLAGRYGCLNANQNAALTNHRTLSTLDQGETLEWCYYCRLHLEIYRLRAEVARLEGDDEQQVWACPACDSSRIGQRGGGVRSDDSAQYRCYNCDTEFDDAVRRPSRSGGGGTAAGEETLAAMDADEWQEVIDR